MNVYPHVEMMVIYLLGPAHFEETYNSSRFWLFVIISPFMTVAFQSETYFKICHISGSRNLKSTVRLSDDVESVMHVPHILSSTPSTVTCPTSTNADGITIPDTIRKAVRTKPLIVVGILAPNNGRNQVDLWTLISSLKHWNFRMILNILRV
jgi:hypothetical protein